MKTIYLIRHGQTDASLRKALCGRTDLPLNAAGIQQIQKLVPWLEKTKPSTIYASPLLRAKQTARIISAHFGTDIVEAKELIEIDFGAWEGLTFKEIKNQDPEGHDKWLASPDKFTPKNAESVAGLCQRVDAFLDKILTESAEGANCYLVTHGGPIRAILIKALAMPRKNYWHLEIPHGSVSRLKYFENVTKLSYMGQVG